MNKLEEKTNEALFALYREENDPDEKRQIRQELTLRYVYIVKAIACQMRNMYQDSIDVEDVVNEGVLEIMRGIDRYDSAKDNKFETFISRRIRGMVIDMMRKNDWLPRNYYKDKQSIEKVSADLAKRNGKQPTAAEIAGELGMDETKVRKLESMTTMVNVLSLDMSYEGDDSNGVLQVPSEDISGSPEKNFMQGETVRILAKAVESLPPNEKTVISLYYVEELNMRQIAEVMNVSQPRVSQLHSQAIKKLRTYMKEAV
jgi:RNA polymerase sigma factor for flagellar operon FliA